MPTASAVDVPAADPIPDVTASLIADTVEVPTADPTATRIVWLTAVAVDVPVAVPTAADAASCCAVPEIGKAAIGCAAMPKSAI